jgi:hypothetical protein
MKKLDIFDRFLTSSPLHQERGEKRELHLPSP